MHSHWEQNVAAGSHSSRSTVAAFCCVLPHTTKIRRITEQWITRLYATIILIAVEIPRQLTAQTTKYYQAVCLLGTLRQSWIIAIRRIEFVPQPVLLLNQPALYSAWGGVQVDNCVHSSVSGRRHSSSSVQVSTVDSKHRWVWYDIIVLGIPIRVGGRGNE